MLRRHAPRAVLAIVFALVCSVSCVEAYSVTIRWRSDGDPFVAGYRLHVKPADAEERAPIDVPRPRRDGSGRFESVIADLQVEAAYTFTITAYDAFGTESARSNPYTIGYVEAARVVDSDHDGLPDGAEDVDLDQRVDDGETNRLVADTDGDQVPDGLERGFGSDPLDVDSPSCAPLGFSEFRLVGLGSANVGWDDELGDLALATTPSIHRATSIGVMYPQWGKGTLREPLLVTRVRDNDPFRIDVHARSTDGKLYRLRYEGLGRIERVTRRRLRRSLGNHFTGERWESIGIDVAADIAHMDPSAIFDHIERLTVRGNLVMQQPRICR
ncbi:MAG: fibronectin type III domain-containing protein [Deltaproteobacteria bacterium]|nr:fibronectin type III domain-containing protein [Deltaproteobacteria bacterium]